MIMLNGIKENEK